MALEHVGRGTHDACKVFDAVDVGVVLHVLPTVNFVRAWPCCRGKGRRGGCRGRCCKCEGRWGSVASGHLGVVVVGRRPPFNAPTLSVVVDVEIGVLCDEILESPLGKQLRELSKNLLLRPSRLLNQFMIDLLWVEGSTVGPQAHAYQFRRALQISRYQFRRAPRRARNITSLMYRQRLVRRRRRVHNATEKAMQDLNWHVPVFRA